MGAFNDAAPTLHSYGLADRRPSRSNGHGGRRRSSLKASYVTLRESCNAAPATDDHRDFAQSPMDGVGVSSRPISAGGGRTPQNGAPVLDPTNAVRYRPFDCGPRGGAEAIVQSTCGAVRRLFDAVTATRDLIRKFERAMKQLYTAESCGLGRACAACAAFGRSMKAPGRRPRA